MARQRTTTLKPRRDWAKRAERHALTLHPALLEQACENSRTIADAAFLMGLAREIALARGPEMTLAYRSVVMVQPGFRKTAGTDGRSMLTREPCVVFVVRKKWRGGLAQAADPQQLPRWLVTFAEHAGQRLPFAVATDVQEAAGFSGARAHGPASVWLQPPGVDWEHGAAACAVRFDSAQGGSQTCLLSAQHVLTPAADVNALEVRGGLPARPLDAQGVRLQAPVVATTLPVGGVLRGEEDPQRPSFDVQIARIDNFAAARAIVGARRLNAAEPWIKSPERLWALGAIRWFHLLVPDNNGAPARGPLQAQLDAPMALPFGIDYRLRRGAAFARVTLFHDELLKFQISAEPFPIAGDSGCAVVVMQGDGSVTLAGLYIGGDADAAYAIPAWQLFDLRRWWSFPSGTRISPVSL